MRVRELLLTAGATGQGWPGEEPAADAALLVLVTRRHACSLTIHRQREKARDLRQRTLQRRHERAR
jgi:hypothetical protein